MIALILVVILNILIRLIILPIILILDINLVILIIVLIVLINFKLIIIEVINRLSFINIFINPNYLILIVALIAVLELIICIGIVKIIDIHLIGIIFLEVGCVEGVLVENGDKLGLVLLVDYLIICKVIREPGMLEYGVD